MIRNFAVVWPKEPIVRESVFRPKYESDEYCICQALNMYVNSKTPFFFGGVCICCLLYSGNTTANHG